MKIKDLPRHTSMKGIRFVYPGDGQKYYWASQWQKGVWGRKDANSQQVFPLFVSALSDCLEWEVVE